MIKNKPEIINDLNLDELSVLLESILSKINLNKVKRTDSQTIEAFQDTGLENRKLVFLLTTSELVGKDRDLLEKIKKMASDFDTLYIATNSKKKISNYFQGWLTKEVSGFQIKYWDNSYIINQIENHLPNYWSHSDTFILPYEDYFIAKIKEEIEIRSLLKLDNKYDKLLDIFIEPKISTFVNDKETDRLIKKLTDRTKIVKSGSYILSGEAGTGKTTLLKQIGQDLVSNNAQKGEKNLPIYIKLGDLTNGNFVLSNTISNILLKVYESFDIELIYQKYSVVLLIDSIDEFEKQLQKNILEQLNDLCKNHNIRYIISTRNYDYLLKECSILGHERISISNFNLRQVKNFLDNFFRFDTLKSDKLWHSLQENNILDKLPITPLTLSILSILYEERQYEIPATITDVYDNFNLFLLGRTTVKSNLEFIDINIKERILSLYGLEIIQNVNRQRKNVSEFTEFISAFFETRNKLTPSVLPELVNSLTQGTGILFIDENDKVSFKHDYFMEYYASLEIFKQRRDLEHELIEHFTDFNWQNTGIFYAGRTKDMPDFLGKLIEQVKTYHLLNDCLIGASGMGYMLQALWLTDAKLRKEAIKNSLDLLVKADEKIKEFAASKFPFFNNIKVPDIALLNLFWFHQHYNSVTLKESLSLAFEDLFEQHKIFSQSTFNSERVTLEFKMFCIANTLASGTNGSREKIEKLFDIKGILTNPLLVMLFDVAIEMLNPNLKPLLSEKNIENRKRKYWSGIKFYIDNSADKLRLSTWDNIQVSRNVEVYTEGKTDAEIIKHAHNVLTNNSISYWNIRACNNVKTGTGGAHELSKFLSALAPKLDNEADKDKIIIGLFDNDEKGIQEFNGLKPNLFDAINGRVKKHKDTNIYAIKLPIPPDKEHYIKDKQSFNFFAIEHYLPLEFLKSNNIIKESDLDKIYEIITDKTKASSLILKNHEIINFLDFKYLFQQFDELSNNTTIYDE